MRLEQLLNSGRGLGNTGVINEVNTLVSLDSRIMPMRQLSWEEFM